MLEAPGTHLPPSPSSFFQGVQKRVLQHILSQWHLRVWGPDLPSGDMKTMLALEAWGSSPRWEEAWLGCRTSGGTLEVRGWSGVEMWRPFLPSFLGPHPPGGLSGGYPESSQVAEQGL